MSARTKSRVDQVMEQVAESSAVATGAIADNEVALLPPDVYKARIFAQVQAEARALTTKETVPGGCFLVDGMWVDANGDAVSPPEGV